MITYPIDVSIQRHLVQMFSEMFKGLKVIFIEFMYETF